MGDSPKWVKAKTEKKRKKKERNRERLNNGDNNGQATHGARKPPGPKNYTDDHNPDLRKVRLTI